MEIPKTAKGNGWSEYYVGMGLSKKDLRLYRHIRESKQVHVKWFL